MRMYLRLMYLALGLGLLLPARAVVRAACLFADHMVLQQGQAVPVWGKADPGEAVTVTFGVQRLTTTAGKDGKWKVALSSLPADATPRELTIAGAANTVVCKDVLVGEVWLCSGQSNMVWEVRSCLQAAQEIAAADCPTIRAYTAGYASSNDQGYRISPTIQDKLYALTPQDTCLGSWQAVSPKTVGNISGVAYFFARQLQQQLHVPIGVIVSATGATAIESWTSLDGLKAVPAYRERALAFEEASKMYLADKEHYPQALETLKTKYLAQCQKYYAKLDAEEPGIPQHWMAPTLDTAKWSTVKLPVSVDDNPIGSPVASIWFRKEVTIPPEWVGKALEVHLGVLDAADETYINGVRVGRTWFDTPNYWTISRVYPIPAAVTSTKVTIALRLLKLAYHLGIFGPAEEMKLVPAGATDVQPVSLAGEWRLRKAKDLEAGEHPQLPPSGTAIPGTHYGHPGMMYNGLIHPLAPFAIKGAIWYQGEANAPFYIDYRSLLPGLITSWRKEWGQGDFPFGIVQLASYYGQQTKPVERGGYTNLRESQAMALRLPNTFMATAFDIGEGNNIHPRNKQETGRRLALPALGTVYGRKDLLYNGPGYQAMIIEGNRIRLRFDFARGLHANGDPPVGFAIAGADRVFRFAQAKIEGETVVVWSAKVPAPVAVRYGWATNPVCNLYNAENLPIFPFHTDSWDLSQLVIPTDETVTLPTGWVAR